MSFANKRIPVENLRCRFCKYKTDCRFKYFKARKIVHFRGGMLEPLVYKCPKGEAHEVKKAQKRAKKEARKRAKWKTV